MVTASASRLERPLHPIHAVLVDCAAPLFLGGLLSDIAYARTYEIQWLNFASWLIAGAMVFTGFALAWSVIEVVLGPARRGRALIIALLLLIMFVIGLLNSFMHARDAWGAMPSGLVMSLVLTALSLAAVWLSVASSRTGAAS